MELVRMNDDMPLSKIAGKDHDYEDLAEFIAQSLKEDTLYRVIEERSYNGYENVLLIKDGQDPSLSNFHNRLIIPKDFVVFIDREPSVEPKYITIDLAECAITHLKNVEPNDVIGITVNTKHYNNRQLKQIVDGIRNVAGCKVILIPKEDQ